MPIALVPLDATDQVPLTARVRRRGGSIDNELAAVEAVPSAAANLDYMFMWDELAAVLAVQPEVATWSERSIVVEDDGSTVESPAGMARAGRRRRDAASARSLVLHALDIAKGDSTTTSAVTSCASLGSSGA